MNFEDLQSKWQSHNPGLRLNIDPDALLKEVRCNHRTLESQIWWRDINEVMAALLITIAFAVLSVLLSQWTLLLCAAGSLFVGLFFVIDRVKQRHRRAAEEESLHSTLETAIAQVEHQIWLLKNVWKWYLLPLVPGLVMFLASSSFQSPGGVLEDLVIAAVGIVCAIAFWQVYRINLREIHRTLEPRRLELEELRANLNQPPVDA